MKEYTIDDVFQSNDRYQLYVLFCKEDAISEGINWLGIHDIHPINIGNKIASFIDELEDYVYLNIDVLDYLKKLLDSNKVKKTNNRNEVIAIYNFGILLEPVLGINVVKVFREYSKTTSLIIIWQDSIGDSNHLKWATQTDNYSLDFSETPLKKLQHAI